MSIAVLLTNVLVGGTPRHAKELVTYWSKSGCQVIFIHVINRVAQVSIFENGDIVRKYYVYQDIETLVKILKYYDVKLLHVEHILHTNPKILQLHRMLDIPLVVTLHDYYTICPFIQLTYENHNYCGEKGTADCKRCLARRNFYSQTLEKTVTDIKEWRNYWYTYLKEASLVMVPSEDEEKRIRRYFPDLKVVVKENPEIVQYRPIERQIGLIGLLSIAKGAQKIKDVLSYCAKYQVQLHFVLFGELRDVQLTEDEAKYITILGKYKEEEIYAQIGSQFIDFFWFPPVCPETYSYTLSIPIRLGIPCVGTNLGAIASRIQANHWGKTYPWNDSAENIVRKLMNFRFENYKKSNFRIQNTSFGTLAKYYNGLLSVTDIQQENKNSQPELTVPNVFKELHSTLTARELAMLWQDATVLQKLRILRYIDVQHVKKLIKKKGWAYFLQRVRERL